MKKSVYFSYTLVGGRLKTLPYDGTILHGIVRILPTVCEDTGYRWKTLYLKATTW
ncbi:hypothetical protein [Nitrosomonas sp. Nm33]|uniref:hypothetical protein n=1 Tax=Nitrosomonas sp. Nm33 TaxID=133724 RepID=UPI0015A31475|nr:hypothetical protein [Nitrosomonas sp. Nm33]